jgi:N-acetylmuramoyl-L-alanine amidase
MASFLLSYLLHSTVVFGIVLLVTGLPKLNRASVRDVLYKVALITSVCTALFQQIALPVIWITPIALETPAPNISPVMNGDGVAVPQTATDLYPQRGTLQTEAVKQNVSVLSLMMWLLFGSSFILVMLRFGHAFILLRNLLCTAKPVKDECLTVILKHQKARRANVNMLSSKAITTPLALGRRTILLPASLQTSLSQSEIENVLLHEYAHLKRYDPLWNTALSFLVHVFFFQPLNFLVLRSWRQASEELCDAYAVGITSDPKSLAHCLLVMARQQNQGPHILTSGIAQKTRVQKTHLSQRITALLNRKEQHMKRFPLALLALFPITISFMMPMITVAQTTGNKVIIDAGHGGIDPGVTGFVQESEVVLQVAEKLKEVLESQGVTVIMTREDNQSYPSLVDRVAQITEDTKLLVSIHANSGLSANQEGIETWIARESSLQITGSTLKTPKFARDVHSELIRATGAKDRGLRSNDFYIVRNSSVPAVLINIGFVSSKEESLKLASESYQQTLAEAMATAIVNYFEQ